MGEVRKERLTADIHSDFVVFLIGMRINVFWKVHKWFPAFKAMPKMLKELSKEDESGLLGFRTRVGVRNVEVIQYWDSFEKLHAYARDENAEHLPAWADFNKKISNDGSVGIWHETYLVEEDQYEAVYRNMPQYGLAEATNTVRASGRRKTAAGRLGKSKGKDSPFSGEGDVGKQ